MRGSTPPVTRFSAFRQELQQLGWIDGRNMQIDIRWGGSDADRRKYAVELICTCPGRHLGLYHACHGGVAPDDQHCAHCIRERHRSGRGRFCPQFGAAGWKCNGIYNFRIQREH
jgi:hypothetical protein